MIKEAFCIRTVWFRRSPASGELWAGSKMARQTCSTGALYRQKLHSAAWDSCEIVEDWHDLVRRLNFLHFILIHIFTSVSFSYLSTVSHKCALLKYKFQLNTILLQKEMPDAEEHACNTTKGTNLPWVEKYRPNGLQELISHEDIISTIRSRWLWRWGWWCTSWSN